MQHETRPGAGGEEYHPTSQARIFYLTEHKEPVEEMGTTPLLTIVQYSAARFNIIGLTEYDRRWETTVNAIAFGVAMSSAKEAGATQEEIRYASQLGETIGKRISGNPDLGYTSIPYIPPTPQ